MPDLAPHWPGSSASGELQVIPNELLCAVIFVIWAAMTFVKDKDDRTSTHLDSHVNMAVAGPVISRSRKSADMRPLSKDCSRMTAVPIDGYGNGIFLLASSQWTSSRIMNTLIRL